MKIPACLRARARLYAFVGNSLLEPMREDTSFGLELAFWDEVAADAVVSGEALTPVRCAVKRLAARPRIEALERLGVAHTKLFVGPGTPAAPPWETLHRSGGTVLFGQATFDMRSELRAAGLQVEGRSRQLEDHMGVELLLASVLCNRLADALESDGGAEDAAAKLELFIRAHPGAWIASLRDQVEAADTTGYYAGLLALAEGLLADGVTFQK